MTFVATTLGLSGCEMPEMLDGGVRTGEKVRFVAAVLPPHDVRRRSVGASHLEHFSIAVRLARLVPMDDGPITYVCLHRTLLVPMLHVHDLPRLAGSTESKVLRRGRCAGHRLAEGRWCEKAGAAH